MSAFSWHFGLNRSGFTRRGLRTFLLAGTVLLSGTGFAQAQSLEQALSAAYANNPALLAERAELRATDEGVPQALGRWRPTVELVGSLGVNQTRQNVGANDVDTTPRTVTFQVIQNLYEGGGTDARVAVAEAEVNAARARLLDTEQGILLETVTAFMDLFNAALVTGALCTDAAMGSAAPFRPEIHDLRGQPGQMEAAAALRALLEGSEIRESHRDDDERVQDPYCIRCQPQVMGACLDLLRHCAGTLEREANAVTDNPLVFPDSGDILSGGNFHGC